MAAKSNRVANINPIKARGLAENEHGQAEHDSAALAIQPKAVPNAPIFVRPSLVARAEEDGHVGVFPAPQTGAGRVYNATVGQLQVEYHHQYADNESYRPGKK